MKRSPSGDLPPLEKLGTGFRKRTLGTLKTMARVGWSMARRNRSQAEVDEAVDEEQAVEWAETVLAELDELKGLALKVGQMMSYLDASIPPKARRVLSRLQFASRSMAYEQIAPVVEEALGASPEALFDTFEPTPFAAASIGQVHRAWLGGQPLAVKVQYPEISRLLSSDLKTVGRLARFVSFFGPLDGPGLVGELEGRLLDECDYEREADHQERFRLAFAGRAGLSIPKVYRELSARTVLTTELVERMGFHDFVECADQAARDRAGALIYEAAFQGIFRYCTYNADPHPGNYLFTDGGAVTLLDFGCVKRFSPEFVERWKRLARSVLDGDKAAFRVAFADCGLVGRARRFDFDHQLEAMRVLYEPMRSTKPFLFTEAFMARVHDALVFKNRNKFKLTLPPDFLWVNRLQLGMFSVLTHIGARVQWGRIFREALDAPIQPLQELRRAVERPAEPPVESLVDPSRPKRVGTAG